jgi:hypothetical protein
VDDDGNIIDSCFKTFGCGSAIASSSVATEWVKGRHIDGAASIKNSDIAKHLSLPPVKLHCSMLAEDAIKARARAALERACVRCLDACSENKRACVWRESVVSCVVLTARAPASAAGGGARREGEARGGRCCGGAQDGDGVSSRKPAATDACPSCCCSRR